MLSTLVVTDVMHGARDGGACILSQWVMQGVLVCRITRSKCKGIIGEADH